ncbi:MAG: hypothetical protein ACM3YF_04970 [Candidatus Zixiibacteriota bacterium]
MKRKHKVTLWVSLSFLILVIIFFYLVPILTKVEVYIGFDSSCKGSNLFIDGEKVHTIGTAVPEQLSYFLTSGKIHEVRLSKPGEIDLVSWVNLKDVGEYYMLFSFEDFNEHSQVIMEFDSSCNGSTLFINGRENENFNNISEQDPIRQAGFFPHGKWTFKLTKPGKKDIVYSATYTPQIKSDTLRFSFAHH